MQERTVDDHWSVAVFVLLLLLGPVAAGLFGQPWLQ
jgi:hypothetical protein